MTVTGLDARIRDLSPQRRREFWRGLQEIAGHDDARLVACVKARSQAALDRDELRDFLAARLPPYMVPNVIVEVDSLPRLANGKIDRRQLPQSVSGAAREASPAESRRQAAPADAAGPHARLAGIWARTLDTDYVLPEDDFFELGGHSLLGVQLLLEVKREFGVEIPLADLFDASRLEDMARRLEGGDARERAVVTIQHGTTQTPIFAVHGGDKTLAAAFGPDRPLYLVFESISTSRADMRSVESIAAHYLRGIREIQPRGPYFLCGFSFGGMVAYEAAVQLRRAGETVAFVAMMDPFPPDVGKWAIGLRFYRILSELRRKRGFLAKSRYLFLTVPERLWRRVPAILRQDAADPQQYGEIQEANLRMYFAIGFAYRYPTSDFDCAVYIPERHPLWIGHLRRKWRKVATGPLTIDCIEGALQHEDMSSPRYGAIVARKFAAAVTSVEDAATDASD